MDAISADVQTLTTDARRAAHPGAIGDAPDHPGSIVSVPLESVLVPTAPSASPLSVSIDGPGLFIVERDGHRCYTRLGDFRFDSNGRLVDGEGRTVLGFASTHPGRATDLVPIERRGAKNASIDENGVVTVDRGSGHETLGRIALGIFPAPEHLGRVDDTSLRASVDSGMASIVLPGTPNVGYLRQHALENAFVDVAGDLEGMWRAQRRGETQAAAAAAADSCERAVLGLVR